MRVISDRYYRDQALPPVAPTATPSRQVRVQTVPCRCLGCNEFGWMAATVVDDVCFVTCKQCRDWQHGYVLWRPHLKNLNSDG